MMTKQDYLTKQNFPDNMESIPTYQMHLTESVDSVYEDVKISSVVGIAHGRHENHTKWSDVLLGLTRFEDKQDLLENPSLIFDEAICKANPDVKNGFYFYRINHKLYLAQGMHRFIIMKFGGIETVKNVLIDERVYKIPPRVFKKLQNFGYMFKRDWYAKDNQSSFQLCKVGYTNGVIRPGAQVNGFVSRAGFDDFLSGIDLDDLKTTDDFENYYKIWFKNAIRSRKTKHQHR